MLNKKSIFTILVVSALYACGSGGGGGSGNGDGSGDGGGNKLDAAPTGLTIKRENLNNIIKWKSVAKANFYRVYYSKSPNVSKKDSLLPDVFGTTSAYHSCKKGITYYYRVTANTSSESTGLSKEVSAKCGASPKNAPAIVQVQGAKNKATVYFSSVDDAKSYNLYYDTKATFDSAKLTVIKDVTSPYLVSGLNNNKEYFFKISAVNNIGETTGANDTSTTIGKRLDRVLFNTQFTGVAYDGSKFVLVGHGGSIYTTTDGTTLTEQDSGTEIDLYSVTSDGSGNLMAVGNQIVLTSTDGVTWERSMPHFMGSFLKVRYLNGNYVLVENNGSVLWTSDFGTTWDVTDIGENHFLNDVAYGAGFYVVTGEVNASGAGLMARSTDLSNWVKHEVGSGGNDTQAIAFDGTNFVVQDLQNKTHTSSDAVNWSESNCGGTCPVFSELIWDGSQFVGFGGDIQTSPDGTTWTQRNNSTENSFGGAYDGSSLYVAAGYSMFTAYSGNSTSWTEDNNNSLIKENLTAIGSDGSYLIAVGNEGGIYQSSDASNWTKVDTAAEALNDVVGCAGGIVAVGENDTVIYHSSPPFTTAWSTVDSPLADTANLFQVECNNGTQAVTAGNAAGTGGVIYSDVSDLSTWSSSTGYAVDGAILVGLAIGDDDSAIATHGSNNFRYTSDYTAASAWTSSSDSDLDSCKGGFFDQGGTDEFICYSSTNIAHSYDMTSWSSFSLTPSNLNKVAHTGNNYLVLGSQSYLGITDGAHFGDSVSLTQIGTNGSYSFQDAYKFGNLNAKIVVVGQNGYIAIGDAADYGL